MSLDVTSKDELWDASASVGSAGVSMYSADATGIIFSSYGIGISVFGVDEAAYVGDFYTGLTSDAANLLTSSSTLLDMNAEATKTDIRALFTTTDVANISLGAFVNKVYGIDLTF